ncbi:MAG: class I SAM-dependent methyltransferase [Arenimonas sp.]|uniref:class I SAM-dependent methyltransferase n=1 Tax=Arenimonas sp. TaxID=1872635 RepID=UPI003C09CD86
MIRTDSDTLHGDRPLTGIDALVRKQVLAKLGKLRHGHLQLREAGECRAYGDPAMPGFGTLTIMDGRFFGKLAFGGSVGAAESYMDGDWQSDDLVGLMRLLIRNRNLLDAMEGGGARFAGWMMQAAHALRRNTRSGSRKNIAAHYDLGNALFELFLDPSLMYSSAVFDREGMTLEQASQRKLQLICEKLELGADDHLIEIGTGWGGMAIYAAKHTGCRVTTTTISQEQFDLAKARIEAEGLQDRITLLFKDYRDLEGRYDKLVSIEMIEAIGHQFQDTYFAKCASLLKPGGKALIQAITIEDHRYQQALDSVDFIKRYIFPGSYIPCVSAMVASAAQAGQLRLLDLQDIGDSYAKTIHAWRERFLARETDVLALGYDRRFLRMWDFYLAYCEAGFLEQSISDVHLLFGKERYPA